MIGKKIKLMLNHCIQETSYLEAKIRNNIQLYMFFDLVQKRGLAGEQMKTNLAVLILLWILNKNNNNNY